MNWDKKVGSDGDNVRRVLGTVFTPPKCESPLCGFDQFGRDFLRKHYDEIEDVEDYDTQFSAVNEALNAADFLAYSSVFSEYGNGGGGKDYIAMSREQITKAIKSLDNLTSIVNK